MTPGSHRCGLVALLGRPNAGKSTLLNALSGSEVYVADQLFATLDPTTRRVTLPGGREVLFTDTVGFIQRLPTTLVAAFRATLEEITEADLLIHVLDISHPNAPEHADTVRRVLQELGGGEIPCLTALNKVDRIGPAVSEEDVGGMAQELGLQPDYVAISGLRRWGLEQLCAQVEEIIDRDSVALEVTVPYNQPELLTLFHERGRIEAEEYGPDGVHIRGQLPRRYLHSFARLEEAAAG